MTPGQEGGGSFPPPLCFRRAAAKKEAAKQAWRPKSREETPKEGSNPMEHQVAMHKLVVASHKIKASQVFLFCRRNDV
jgi:hypothetical protein